MTLFDSTESPERTHSALAGASLVGTGLNLMVTALHDRVESVRRSELERFRSKLSRLDDTQLDAVETLTKDIVAKLLYDPTVELIGRSRSLSSERLTDDLRDLFDL